MNNREIAQKIYEKLLEKGAGIGNASIPIIEKVLDESSQFEPRVSPMLAEENKVDCNNCYECLKDKTDGHGLPIPLTRMILCPICGNKRCPKATDHNLECTNSNESGQAGSRY